MLFHERRLWLVVEAQTVHAGAVSCARHRPWVRDRLGTTKAFFHSGPVRGPVLKEW
jgi:hypothetical protein